jgi:hypothetical protein
VNPIRALWGKAEGSGLVAVLLTWGGVTAANVVVAYVLVVIFT